MIKRIYLLFLVLTVTAAAGAAQGGMDPFDLHVSSLRILQNRAVQAELGVTVPQRAKMDKFADGYNSELNAYLAELKKQNKADEQLPDETMSMMLARLKENVMAVLTPPQLKRLREISLQAYGLNGLMDDTVATRVGLSKAQVTQMQAKYKDGSKQANDLMTTAIQPVNAQFKNAKPKDQQEANTLKKAYETKSDAAMNAVMPKVQQIRSQTQIEILAMITAKQKQDYLALQGKPFHAKKTGLGTPTTIKKSGKKGKAARPKH
jgi:hypothetical protein